MGEGGGREGRGGSDTLKVLYMTQAGILTVLRRSNKHKHLCVDSCIHTLSSKGVSPRHAL